MNILILNGPNLNLLGRREPSVYGEDSLGDLEGRLRARFPDASVAFFQSNVEGELVNRLHETLHDGTDGVVFNPGGYTHTSIALRDAVAAITAPVIEVHISNVSTREPFRHTSVLAPVCAGQIAGLGLDSYAVAIHALLMRAGT